jgi:hypothetical protein
MEGDAPGDGAAVSKAARAETPGFRLFLLPPVLSLVRLDGMALGLGPRIRQVRDLHKRPFNLIRG